MGGLIPLPYRIAAGVVFIVAIFAAGYFYGWSGINNNFIAYKSKVDEAGRQQSEQSKQKEIENDRQTKAVEADYLAERTALFGNLERLRVKSAGGGSMPSNADSAKGVNGTAVEQLGDCEGSKFYTNALDDAMKLKWLQSWIRAQRFPVSN